MLSYFDINFGFDFDFDLVLVREIDEIRRSNIANFSQIWLLLRQKLIYLESF